jgi:hypothetical protein
MFLSRRAGSGRNTFGSASWSFWGCIWYSGSFFLSGFPNLVVGPWVFFVCFAQDLLCQFIFLIQRVFIAL